MNEIKLGIEYLKELESESVATRKCLERIPGSLFNWKPHERSMNLGYLSLLVSEIPKWISYIVDKAEIDFVTFPHVEVKTTEELLSHHDENMKLAKQSLSKVTNEELEQPFSLKNDGQVLFTSTKKVNVSSSINHLVHHRGQLTVYMRLNNLPVPSIYGPSADDNKF